MLFKPCKLFSYFLGSFLAQRLNFDGFVYIYYAAPPYSAGIVIIENVDRRLVKNSSFVVSTSHIVLLS